MSEPILSRGITLWSPPRCLSTVFERSIITREDTRVFHEPFGETFYYGTEAGSTRYADQPRVSATYESLAHKLRDAVAENSKPFVFTKDISYFIKNRVGELTVPANTQHTFILRHPRAAIKSMYSKSCVDNAKTQWTYFDPEEAGFKYLYEIYHYVTDVLHQIPVIVDAGDLVENPGGILRAYCNAVDIPYSDSMLTWSPGPVPEWGPIETREPGWHDDAINSSGFRKSKSHFSESTEKKSESVVELPDEVEQVIADSMVYYNEMHALRLRPISA